MHLWIKVKLNNISGQYACMLLLLNVSSLCSYCFSFSLFSSIRGSFFSVVVMWIFHMPRKLSDIFSLPSFSLLLPPFYSSPFSPPFSLFPPSPSPLPQLPLFPFACSSPFFYVYPFSLPFLFFLFLCLSIFFFVSPS